MCVAKNASVEINLKAGKTAITKKKLKKQIGEILPQGVSVPYC